MFVKLRSAGTGTDITEKTTRNAIRDLKEVKENKPASEKLPGVISMIDKLAKKGIIHKNKASNIKRKLARRVNKLAAA